MSTILEIVATWLFSGMMPALTEADLEIVNHGFGMIVPDAGVTTAGGKVKASENIVAASLTTWLNSKNQAYSLRHHLNVQLATPDAPSRGTAFENIMIYMLWQAFADGAPLDSVFDFCYLSPSWKSQKARLIDIFKAASQGGNPQLVNANLTSRLAWRTSTTQETLAWFDLSKYPHRRIPMLKPDNGMGPDIVFGLLLPGHLEIFVCVQCKCWSTKHSAADVEDLMFKLSPEGFYVGKNVGDFLPLSRV